MLELSNLMLEFKVNGNKILCLPGLVGFKGFTIEFDSHICQISFVIT